jgi:hypothetical protein
MILLQKKPFHFSVDQFLWHYNFNKIAFNISISLVNTHMVRKTTCFLASSPPYPFPFWPLPPPTLAALISPKAVGRSGRRAFSVIPEERHRGGVEALWRRCQGEGEHLWMHCGGGVGAIVAAFNKGGGPRVPLVRRWWSTCFMSSFIWPECCVPEGSA